MYARFSSSLLANAVADCSAYFRCVCQKALHYLKRVLEYRLVVDSVLPPPASTQKQSGTPFGDLISKSTPCSSLFSFLPLTRPFRSARILKALLTNLEDKADKVRKKEKVIPLTPSLLLCLVTWAYHPSIRLGLGQHLHPQQRLLRFCKCKQLRALLARGGEVQPLPSRRAHR